MVLKHNFGKAKFVNWLSGFRRKNGNFSTCLHWEQSFIHCKHMNHFDSLPVISSTSMHICQWSSVFTLSYDEYFKAVCLTSSVELWNCTPLTHKYLAFQKNRSPPNQVHWRVHLKALIRLQLTKAITMWWVILFPPCELLCTVERHLTKCSVHTNFGSLLRALVPKLDRGFSEFSYKQDHY